jgi:hypothetical protein
MHKAQFLSLPRNVRLGIIFTIAGWVFLILSNAVITSTIAILQITLALVCSVVIYSLKPWARFFCIVINVFVIASNAYVLYGLFFTTLADTQTTLPSAAYLINILLFAAATFFLLNRETSAFYKQQGVEK